MQVHIVTSDGRDGLLGEGLTLTGAMQWPCLDLKQESVTEEVCEAGEGFSSTGTTSLRMMFPLFRILGHLVIQLHYCVVGGCTQSRMHQKSWQYDLVEL